MQKAAAGPRSLSLFAEWHVAATWRRPLRQVPATWHLAKCIRTFEQVSGPMRPLRRVPPIWHSAKPSPPPLRQVPPIWHSAKCVFQLKKGNAQPLPTPRTQPAAHARTHPHHARTRRAAALPAAPPPRAQAAARAPWPRARPPAARAPGRARTRPPPEKFPLLVLFLAAALLLPAAGGAALRLPVVRCSYWLALAGLGLGLALHGTWLCARNRGEQRAAAASHGMTSVRSESASYRRRDAPAPSKLHVRSGRGSGGHGSGVRQACSGRP
jgi:hypothetical protein